MLDVAKSACGAAVLLAAAATPALASEAMLGVYQHDIMDGISHGGHFEHGKDIVVGLRTTSLDELSFLGKPRVHVILGLNTLGGTDFAAAGFSWRFGFGPEDRFYLEPGIGAAIHTGAVNLPSPLDPGLTQAEIDKRLHDFATKLDLGSRVLFEPELALGWKATDRWSLEVSWIHMSHAQLAGPQNPGLGDFGLRAVYRFGADRGHASEVASEEPSPRERRPVNGYLAERAPEAPMAARAAVNGRDVAAVEPSSVPQRAAAPLAIAALLSPAPSSAEGAYEAQIAATSSARAAGQALDSARREIAAALGTPSAGRIETSVLRGAPVYRALVTGFDDAGSANAFCARLKASGQACFVRAPPRPAPGDVAE